MPERYGVRADGVYIRDWVYVPKYDLVGRIIGSDLQDVPYEKQGTILVAPNWPSQYGWFAVLGKEAVKIEEPEDIEIRLATGEWLKKMLTETEEHAQGFYHITRAASPGLLPNDGRNSSMSDDPGNVPHMGKTIEQRRFESYTADTSNLSFDNPPQALGEPPMSPEQKEMFWAIQKWGEFFND